MAKCINCGKIFDYEKYYGICPKCSTYNREDTPEEEHQELHEKYDSAKNVHVELDEAVKAAYQNEYGPQYQQQAADFRVNRPVQSRPVQNGSSVGTVVFVLLLVALVVSILLVPIYIMTQAARVGRVVNESIYDALESMDGEDWGVKESEEVEHIPQEVDITDVSVGTTVSLGRNGDVEFTVNDVRTMVPAGFVEDFPEGEKLVAISVTCVNYTEEYTDYTAVDKLYIGYGENHYKEVMSEYDMEDYMDIVGGTTIVDDYSFYAGSLRGDILVFVPEDVNTFDLYLESRDENNLDMLGLYRVPLELDAGEEM